MADSKQLRILKKLTTLLEATSDYTPLPVFRGVAVVSAKDVKDCLSILEAPRPIVGQPAGHEGFKRKEGWTLLVQGWPEDDKKNPSDPAYAMKAAVERQLYKIIEVDGRTGLPVDKSIYLLGGDLVSLTIGQGVVRPPSEEAASRLAMFYLPLFLEIITDVSNPTL